MASFAKKSFDTASYAAIRPSYPQQLYKLILDYHRGPLNQCLDLGCGHGIVARQFGNNFQHFLGTDPSEGMIEQAQRLTPRSEYRHVSFKVGHAEDDVPIRSGGVDVVTAAQSSHWFNQSKVFPLLKDKVRKGGTLAFWGYKDHAFVDFPQSTAILDHYTYVKDPDKLGSYWPKGREIVQDKLRAVKPPEADWEDIQRIEYDPGATGVHTGKGVLLMAKRMKVGECKAYMRTWSSYHAWQEAHPGAKARSQGGNGDVLDDMFDEMAASDAEMGDEEHEIEVEWGSALILARRK